MRPGARYNITALVMLLLLLTPFTVATDPRSDAGHKILLAALGLVAVAVWRMCVNRWGPSGALAAAATALPALVLIQGAVLLGLWPVPDGSLGVFAFTFPIWIAVLSLLSGAALHFIEKGQRGSSPQASVGVSDA